MHVYRKQNKEIKETTSYEKIEIRVLWRVPCFMASPMFYGESCVLWRVPCFISLVTVKNNYTNEQKFCKYYLCTDFHTGILKIDSGY